MKPSVPAVTCTSCSRVWHSASMVEGLRILGSCPRCGGSLNFAADEGPGPAPEPLVPADAVALAPHLVMGIPRL